MKELNLVSNGEIFSFCSNGLRYGVANLDGGLTYKTCNKKFFKYLGSAQFIEVELSASNGKFTYVEKDNTLFNCFIQGRGENKKLYYENVIIVTNN